MLFSIHIYFPLAQAHFVLGSYQLLHTFDYLLIIWFFAKNSIQNTTRHAKHPFILTIQLQLILIRDRTKNINYYKRNSRGCDRNKSANARPPHTHSAELKSERKKNTRALTPTNQNRMCMTTIGALRQPNTHTTLHYYHRRIGRGMRDNAIFSRLWCTRWVWVSIWHKHWPLANGKTTTAAENGVSRNHIVDRLAMQSPFLPCAIDRPQSRTTAALAVSCIGLAATIADDPLTTVRNWEHFNRSTKLELERRGASHARRSRTHPSHVRTTHVYWPAEPAERTTQNYIHFRLHSTLSIQFYIRILFALTHCSIQQWCVCCNSFCFHLGNWSLFCVRFYVV